MDIAGGICDVVKTQLARLTPQHNASGDTDLLTISAALFRAAGTHCGNAFVVVETLAEGVVSQFDNRFRLLEAGRFEAVGLGGC